jgi:hypothetical protein
MFDSAAMYDIGLEQHAYATHASFSAHQQAAQRGVVDA